MSWLGLGLGLGLGQLEVTAASNEDVARLDVVVQHALLVQVAQPQQHLGR